MKRPGFLQGVVVAFAASLVAGAAWASLSMLFGGARALSLLITLLAGAYTVYLLSRSEERIGRVVTLGAWLAAAVSLWLWQPQWPVFLALHLSLVWLTRSLYFHSSLLAALADLGLIALGVGAATWAAVQSHSMALSVWCFFLVQAAFGLIPPRLAPRAAAAEASDDRFVHAHRTAQAAVRRLSSIR